MLASIILTGQKLEEIAKAIWGENWIAPFARRARCSRRRVMRKRDSNNVPAEWRQVLVDAIDEQFAVLGEKRAQLVASEFDM